MTDIKVGDRISNEADRVVLGVCAVIKDPNGRLLLTKRADNGTWVLPGGAIEPGETVWEACRREVKEELGGQIGFVDVMGVYSNTGYLIS